MFHTCLRKAFLPHVILITALSAGCVNVGPDFSRPVPPAARSWAEQEDSRVKTERPEMSRWWHVFQDPVLDALIETAVRQSPTLEEAGLKILEARAQLGLTVGDQFPQEQNLKYNQTFNRLSESDAGTRGASTLETSTYQASLNISWELDLWGRYRRAVESADASLAASIASYDDALVTLLGDVATTYVSIRTAEERMRVARRNVDIMKQYVTLTEAKYRNGAVTELDYQQAQSILLDIEARIPEMEAELRKGRHTLCVLLGMPPGDMQGLLGDSGEIPSAPLEVAVGIPVELLGRRPDVRNAELQAAAQCAKIGYAKADLFPKVSLTGSFGFLATDAPSSKTGGAGFSDLFQWESFTMNTGPTIQWPVLNYGRITNKVRIEDARFQQALVKYRSTVLKAAKEVEDALSGFLLGQDQVALRTRSVEVDKRAVYLSTIQYREGANDFTSVIQTLYDLVQQEDRLATAKGLVPGQLVALYKAMGGGWEIQAGKSFVPADTMEIMRRRTNWGSLIPPRDLPDSLDPKAAPAPLSLPARPDW